MKNYILILAILATISACKSNPNELPPNVIESVESRFESNNPDSAGSVKKVVYIDTITEEKIAEKYFHEDKSLFMEYNFKNGKREGVAKSFYPKTAKPWSLHTYREGQLHGEYKTWFENGQLRMEGQYEMGKEAGVWKVYQENGTLVEEINFDKK